MMLKSDSINANDVNHEIVQWGPKYSVGIKFIDNQHMELVNLTNTLYKACLSSEVSTEATFKDAIHRMVEYVTMHFSTENTLMESVGFPNYSEHKKQHESLIKEILSAVKNSQEGNKMVPIYFVRTLREWIFSHIAIYDQIYAQYINAQVKKGLINKAQLE